MAIKQLARHRKNGVEKHRRLYHPKRNKCWLGKRLNGVQVKEKEKEKEKVSE